jgi:CheY-like chemotaxis protein
VNARDAMPEGGKIVISTENVSLRDGEIGRLSPGPYVKVTVKDSGTGMTPEVQGKAFEPFFTTKEIGKGTGLGLSQVYGFITQCQGEIRLDSQLGAGTTVNIYLPAIEGAPTVIHQKEERMDKVLVVDDDDEIIDVAAELFRTMGYEVLTATSGSKAIDLLKQDPEIDLLFTDVIMPGEINGIQLAHLAKKIQPSIKVILASGYPLPALKAQQGNVDQFPLLNKPYRLSDIAKKLRTLN